jgi:hypothetical protein
MKYFLLVMFVCVVLFSTACLTQEELANIENDRLERMKPIVAFSERCNYKVVNLISKNEYLTDNYTIDANNNLVITKFVIFYSLAAGHEIDTIYNRRMLFSSGSYMVEWLK